MQAVQPGTHLARRSSTRLGLADAEGAIAGHLALPAADAVGILHHQRFLCGIIADDVRGAVVDDKVLALPVEELLVEDGGLGEGREGVVEYDGILGVAVDGHVNGADRAHLHALAAQDALRGVDVNRFCTMRPFSSTASTWVRVSLGQVRGVRWAAHAVEFPGHQVMAGDHGPLQYHAVLVLALLGQSTFAHRCPILLLRQPSAS